MHTRRKGKHSTKFVIIAVGLVLILVFSTASMIITPRSQIPETINEPDVLASYTINSRYIQEYDILIKDLYLFTWNDIKNIDALPPQLRMYLQNLGVNWLNNAKVSIQNNKITITDGTKFALFKLDDTKSKAVLSIDNNIKDEFVVRNEDGKLNVYHTIEPVAIKVKDGIVWFADSKKRMIVRFDPNTGIFNKFPIPGNISSTIISIWSLEFDDNNDIWFTDAVTNSIWRFHVDENRFEQYIIPTKPKDFDTSYPINLVFANGKVWFSQIYGKKIGVIDTKMVKDKSSEGISEIEIASELETLGPLAVDNDNNIWFTALTYPIKGELYKLDTNTLQFTKYDLPADITSPVGIVIDANNKIWINDHGTSTIIIFDPANNLTSRIATALPIKETSPWLYNQCVNMTNPEMCGGLGASLPYWNMIVDGKLFLNMHYGNTIGMLDINNLTLVEYIVPTMNPNYARCDGYKPCGIANVLKFDVNDKIWFTEWSENKIGVVDIKKDIPISLEVNDVSLIRGSSIPIKIIIHADEPLKAEMRISATTSPSGRLVNMSASFSERIVEFDAKGSKTIMLELFADPTLSAGDYMLTITAKLDDVMYSKIIKARVI